MRDVVIDTDVAPLLQMQQAPPWVLRHLAGVPVRLTFVTVGELAKWAFSHLIWGMVARRENPGQYRSRRAGGAAAWGLGFGLACGVGTVGAGCP